MGNDKLKKTLNNAVLEYNRPAFITNDPVSIPHMFSKKQDIEIAGFFAAILAWGQRTTILNNCKNLMSRMDQHPHDFVLHAGKKEFQRLEGFVHRTFQQDDLFYFIHFFQWWYQNHDSLEYAFLPQKESFRDMYSCLLSFREIFFSQEHLSRTHKHVSSPATGSACKRINLFLRWMVRKDSAGVDFGIWESISPSQLICPLDVHVGRIAREFKLLKREKDDWQAALELTKNLRKLDPLDPIKYDYALFGLGVSPKGL